MSLASDEDCLNVQVFVPELGAQKCLAVQLDELIWDIKRKVIGSLAEAPPESFNYGLFLPPCDGRAGKFLLEDRPIRDYPFHDCVPYLELKYKKRVYKMMKLDEKALKQLHSKANLKKFMEHVMHRNVEKIEKMCTQGLDPNFHDPNGETPLTTAASIKGSRDVMITLVGGGAHLDFRNLEGQTPMHKAAFLASAENLKTLLELGGSPNYRDPIGLTPLYYCMLTSDTAPDAAEMLLRDRSDVGVTDMHGNHELHQACKNGLTQHIEHLLYYGAEVDAQNVNGNTPLHVCAVNNRAECARVLLFRGADAGVLNSQGQTAFHVANIVGNQKVAEVIRSHDPRTSAPYRGAPRYNSKRRGSTSVAGSVVGRRRSFSQSSICSASVSVNGHGRLQGDNNNGIYRSPASMIVPASTSSTSHSRMSGSGGAPSPSPSRMTVYADCPRSSAMRMIPPQCTPPSGDYGTLPMRKFAPDIVQQPACSAHEVNVPRILVIPRGPKGFGFILRGAKKMEPGVRFEPSAAVPALQFFEGVDMSGMAMRAGLRPGDFLLAIDGVDVRRASHDQVVQLIQNAGDTIALKVITVDPSQMATRANGGTMPARRARARSMLPPPVPNRHPSTSLSTNRGARFLTQAIQFKYSDDPQQNGHYAQTNGVARMLVPARSTDNINLMGGTSNGHHVTRVASVKSRPSTSRRISAAELENLMTGPSSSYDQDTLTRSTPKKFSSVADMKRRKQQKVAASPSLQGSSTSNRGMHQPDATVVMVPVASGAVCQPLKSFASSPDLNKSFDDCVFQPVHHQQVVDMSPCSSNASTIRKGSDDYSQHQQNGHKQESDYSRPYRAVPRPRTPPPPPPVKNSQATASRTPAPLAGAPPCPAPPPPPPPEALRATGQNGQNEEPARTDCRGVTASALKNVKLKRTQPPVQQGPGRVVESKSSPMLAQQGADDGVRPVNGVKRDESLPSVTKGGGKVDFDSDLRRALAQRRNKIVGKESAQDCTDDDADGSVNGSTGALNTTAAQKKVVFSLEANNVNPTIKSSNGNSGAQQSRFGGLSLKESVRENVGQNKHLSGKKTVQHSPPPVANGFGNKKDSGYTSSRTSLEPSECGEDHHNGALHPTVLRISDDSHSPPLMEEEPGSPDFPPPPPPELLNAAINGSSDAAVPPANRVSMLSQQLEDSFGGQPPPALPRKPIAMTKPSQTKIREHDAVSLASTLSTLSGCSEGTSNSSNSNYHRNNQLMQQQQQQQQQQQHHQPQDKRPMPPLPPPDYDPDSGTGDSDNEDNDITPTISRLDLSNRGCAVANPASTNFVEKDVSQWSCLDVCDWLDSLQLSDYKQRFYDANITGRQLLVCDRARFTSLGVTRIAHRKLIEQTVKRLTTAQ